ncbi:hypothetical protein LCGC14_1726910, partial [marine sediment metagenome]
MGSRMFPFINKTWNPIAGGPCLYDCDYCWARAMIEDPNPKWDNLRKKYTGPMRLHEAAMKVRFKPEDFVFVCDMMDIGDPRIPRNATTALFKKIESHPDTRFLLLTKNPYWYIVWLDRLPGNDRLPKNVYLGATIETNLDHTQAVSHAPSTTYRLNIMAALKVRYPDRPRFISIEPIMDFSDGFAQELIDLDP